MTTGRPPNEPAGAETATSRAQYASSHPKGMGDGYWHIARNRILWRQMAPALVGDNRVLDVGCGPGVVVQYLRRRGVDCRGVDLGAPEPESPEVSPYLYLEQQASELPLGYRQSVTTLLLMDVLEHLPEPLSLLEECYRDFPNARTVYVTVPARMEVWSAWDEFHGHYRRYTIESLESLVAESHYVLRNSGYFFHSLYAAMRVVGALGTRKTVVSSPRLLPVHYLLGRLFDAERLVLGKFRGSSLFAVLRR